MSDLADVVIPTAEERSSVPIKQVPVTSVFGGLTLWRPPCVYPQYFSDQNGSRQLTDEELKGE